MSATQTEARAETRGSRHDSVISLKGSNDNGAPEIVASPGTKTSTPNVQAIELAELGPNNDPAKDGPSPGPTFPAVTAEMRRKANIQFATLCWTLFLGGWMGGTTGPLLPRIQQVYHVRITRTSTVFVLIL